MIIGRVRRSAGVVAGALLVVGGTLAGAIRGGAIVPLVASLRDPQSLFAERSPGARLAGELANTKADHVTGRDQAAPENDVAEVGPNPAFAFGTPGLIDGVPMLAGNPADRVPGYSGDGGGEYFGYGGAGGGAGHGHGHGHGHGGGGSSGGGGGGGGGGSPGSGGGSGGGPPGGGSGGPPGGGGDTPPIVTPVPEPQTWAMMTLGMALIGAAMRRAARSRMAAPSRPSA